MKPARRNRKNKPTKQRRNTAVEAPRGWECVLELNADRSVKFGSPDALRAAIRAGADLRIATVFWHDEHIDTHSKNHEMIQEAMEFRQTFLIDDRWVACVQTLRQPVDPLVGFGPRPSMSFFLYNQDGHQAVARTYLDGGPTHMNLGLSPLDDHGDMPKYHQFDSFDAGTNAPSQNFIYDFDSYRFMVRPQWREVYAHDAKGKAVSGSIDALADAAARGSEVKVAFRDLCDDLTPAGEKPLPHEVFVHMGSLYYYTKMKLMLASGNPMVRVRPGVPMRYASRNWDFGWLIPYTSGRVARLIYDPYTLKPSKSEARCAMRWFVQG